MYRAPEQTWDQATQRSDIYAFGAILYEMLAGTRLPAAGSSRSRVGAEALRNCRADITPGLERLVTQALHVAPERRSADISGIANALAAEITADRPPKSAGGGTVGERSARIGTSTKIVVWGAATAVLVGALVVWFAHARITAAPPRPVARSTAPSVSALEPSAVKPPSVSAPEPSAVKPLKNRHRAMRRDRASLPGQSTMRPARETAPSPSSAARPLGSGLGNVGVRSRHTVSANGISQVLTVPGAGGNRQDCGTGTDGVRQDHRDRAERARQDDRSSAGRIPQDDSSSVDGTPETNRSGTTGSFEDDHRGAGRTPQDNNSRVDGTPETNLSGITGFFEDDHRGAGRIRQDARTGVERTPQNDRSSTGGIPRDSCLGAAGISQGNHSGAGGLSQSDPGTDGTPQDDRSIADADGGCRSLPATGHPPRQPGVRRHARRATLATIPAPSSTG